MECVKNRTSIERYFSKYTVNSVNRYIQHAEKIEINKIVG